MRNSQPRKDVESEMPEQRQLTGKDLDFVCRNIEFPKGRVRWGYLDEACTVYYLQIVMLLPDADNPTGPDTEQRGRKWHISRFSVESEVVYTALYAFLKFMEHEAREQFRYRGTRLFGPHINVNALMEVAEKTEVRA